MEFREMKAGYAKMFLRMALASVSTDAAWIQRQVPDRLPGCVVRRLPDSATIGGPNHMTGGLYVLS